MLGSFLVTSIWILYFDTFSRSVFQLGSFTHVHENICIPVKKNITGYRAAYLASAHICRGNSQICWGWVGVYTFMHISRMYAYFLCGVSFLFAYMNFLMNTSLKKN